MRAGAICRHGQRISQFPVEPDSSWEAALSSYQEAVRRDAVRHKDRALLGKDDQRQLDR